MSDEKTFPTRTPDLFAGDFHASPSATRVNSEHRTTPATSGRKSLDLSGNAGPIGLFEKKLLDSSTWAWTRYSLTWKTKATPQGRLIFQLARSAPRTSAKGSGLLDTPTAKANQTDTGNWVSTLRGAKPHHMVPTPTSQDHIKRKSTNTTPSTGKLNYETNKSVSLDRWVDMWPTPNAREKGGGEYQDPEKIKARMDKGHQTNLGDAVKMWPTPRAQEAKHGAATEWELQTDHAGTKDSLRVQVVKRMWPTPRKSMANGPTSREVNSGETKSRLENAVQIWPTPSAQEPGWKNIEVVDKDGNPPSHHNQRFYDKKTGRVVQKGLQQTVTDPKTGGQLNPMWVAWLMGYPLEWLSCVPWETQSSRKSQRK